MSDLESLGCPREQEQPTVSLDWRPKFQSDSHKEMCTVPLWTVDHTYLSLMLKPRAKEDDGNEDDAGHTEHVRSKKTVRNVPLLAPCESGALAAFCGLHRSWSTGDTSLEDEEDSRDVALVLTMSALLAVPPFHGLHLNSTPCTQEDDPMDPRFQPYHSDLTGMSFEQMFSVPLCRFGAAMIYPTVPVMPGWNDMAEMAVTLLIAAGAVGNLAALAQFSSPSDQLFSAFLTGCLLGDNPTGLQCLLRHPFSEAWTKYLQAQFYVGHSEYMRANTRVPALNRRIPASTFDLLFPTDLEGLEEELANEVMKGSAGESLEGGSPTPGAVCPVETGRGKRHRRGEILKVRRVPQLFTFLASLEGQMIPKLGGCCKWPPWDKSYLYNSIVLRMEHHVTVKIGGVPLTRCDVAALEIEANPSIFHGWLNLATQMQHGQTVKIDDGLSGPKAYDKIQVAARGCELALRGGVGSSLAWNNLAFCMLFGDSDRTATIDGKNYTRVECGTKALDIVCRDEGTPASDSQNAACVWDTMGCLLNKGEVYTAPPLPPLAQPSLAIADSESDDEEATEEVAAEGSTHGVSRPTFSRIQCFVKSLGYNSAYYMSWVHLGMALSDLQPPILDLSDRRLGETALYFLSSYGEESEHLLRLSVALSSGSDCAPRSQEEDEEEEAVAGSGGGNVSVSEELCYRIALAIDEMALLTELANDEPHNLDHIIKAVGQENLSERGKRLLVRKLGFSFDRGSQSYSFSTM